jgi:type I restriction enzyme S subunit
MIDSELGLIPEGWRVTTYGEMEDLKNGINYSRDEHGDTVCKIINTRDIVETNYITDQNLEKINIDKEKAEKYIIDENDILIIRSASPGKVAVVQNPSGMIIYSGFIIRLSPKDINTKWYLYEDLKEKGPKLTKYSESSVMKNINQQIINNTKVIIPSTKILNKYHTIANNIHEKIWNNTLETFNVKKSKNAALNKLIK